MSGVAVVRYLLGSYGPLLAKVPADRIIAGDLSIETPRPAIFVKQISSLPHKLLRGTVDGHTDRVQASALVSTPDAANDPGEGYPLLDEIMKLLPPACPHQRGVVNGINVVEILLEPEGPDLSDEVGLISRTRDFLVRWY